MLVCSIENNFEVGRTYTKLENSKVVSGAIEFTVPEGMNWICLYVYSGSDYSLETIEENRSSLYII
ncbi:hypothetical protein F390_gp14 [Clostridium phage phiCP13O]|uniref:hypothetical protein n=1 Tax=Clostridium phage phiCP13O TaxID=1042122 RepID=UPI000214C7E7|nr:hypothetical protein F390_gp14 [Clostridium phage phiCP13O]AEI74440.1 hypothetical protein phi13O_gp14 [Clostridium phage phiCP13O]